MPGDDYMNWHTCDKCRENYDVRFVHICGENANAEKVVKSFIPLTELKSYRCDQCGGNTMVCHCGKRKLPASTPSAVHNVMDLLAHQHPTMVIRKVIVAREEFVPLITVLSSYTTDPAKSQRDAMSRRPKWIDILGVRFEEGDE